MSLAVCHIAGILKKTVTNYFQESGEITTLIYCCLEWKMLQPLQKTVCHFLQKLNIELPYDPAILLNIYILKKIKTVHVNVHSNIAKKVETTLISIS